MEVPTCEYTYTNECDVPDVGFLKEVQRCYIEYRQQYRPFYFGRCYNCNSTGCPDHPVQRCGGCQLVSYCTRECQKKDRSIHKYVCKAFPVVNGNNVLITKGPWEEHIAFLRKLAAMLPLPEVAKAIFRNPRVCNTCHEARPERFRECKCGCVSYCVSYCAKADKWHKNICHLLRLVAASDPYFLPIPASLQDISSPICQTYTPISHMSDVYPHPSSDDGSSGYNLVYLHEDS